MRAPGRRVAWALAVLSLALTVIDTVIVSASIGLFSSRSLGIHGWPLVDLAATGCAVLGAVIVGTDRRQPIGWLLAVIGFTTSISMPTESYTHWVLFLDGPGATRPTELLGSLLTPAEPNA